MVQPTPGHVCVFDKKVDQSMMEETVALHEVDDW